MADKTLTHSGPQTSSAFASAMAAGGNWREVGRQLLEALESVRTPDDGMNIGFLYATTALAPDLPALLVLLKNVTRITQWYGATGQGVCGNGQSHADMPGGPVAAVAMIGRLPPGSFHGFHLSEADGGTPQSWTESREGAVAVTHGVLRPETVAHLKDLRERAGIYTTGGLTGAEGGQHIADGLLAQPGQVLSGVALEPSVRVMTATSTGCLPAGRPGRITRCHGQRIETIDDRPALDFINDAVAQLKTGDGVRHGHMHAAFPVTGNDRALLLMRNIIELDETAGAVHVAHQFQRGDNIQFVYRDAAVAAADLSHVLTALYARASNDAGAANFRPRGILYFGCGARLPDGPDNDDAALVGKVFGDVPMAGFFTAAEIVNGHVHGYTGVIVLFL